MLVMLLATESHKIFCSRAMSNICIHCCSKRFHNKMAQQNECCHSNLPWTTTLITHFTTTLGYSVPVWHQWPKRCCSLISHSPGLLQTQIGAQNPAIISSPMTHESEKLLTIQTCVHRKLYNDWSDKRLIASGHWTQTNSYSLLCWLPYDIWSVYR